MLDVTLPDRDEITAAAARIEGSVHRTPLVRSRTISDLTGLDVWLKCENFQRTGSFKPRGGLNRLRTLRPEQREAGVITISAGNNAQGIAYAAAETGIQAVLVMPETADPGKVAATRGYGAEVVLHGDVTAAFARLEELVEERGLTLLHPFDDAMLIAGHGTVGREIREDLGEVDAVVCGIGGGGLGGGLALEFSDRDATRVIGVEPHGAATMTAALGAGEPVRLDHVDTIADGLAPPFVGSLNLAIAQAWIDRVELVDDEALGRAMWLLLERTKMLVEPSGAAPLATLMEGALDLRPDSRVVLVLSGGNVSLERLPGMLFEPRTQATVASTS